MRSAGRAEGPPVVVEEPCGGSKDELELTRRLRARNVTMRCPACGWLLGGPVGDYRLAPAGTEEMSAEAFEAVRLKVYACVNCGYIRLHSADVLDEIGD